MAAYWGTSRGGGVLICFKNYIDCRMLWIDEVFEIMAVEVKDGNSKFVWEVVRSLQSSKLGHASYRKIISPEWVYRKPY